MKKLCIVVAALIVVLSGCENVTGDNGEFAQVTSSRQAMKTIYFPVEECRDEVVTLTRETRDPNQIAGTVAGAVIGGVLGNQVGKGTGKDVATVGGAVAGGYAGNQVQEGMQQSNTYQETRQKCTTINDSRQEPAGYDVTYILNGEENTIHLDYEPGLRIPVSNGVLVLKN